MPKWFERFLPEHQGKRELVFMSLLFFPIAALGFYLAAIEVLVDPPSDFVPTPTPIVREAGTPAASPVATP